LIKKTESLNVSELIKTSLDEELKDIKFIHLSIKDTSEIELKNKKIYHLIL
jgi:hypothetical protein